MSDLENQYKNDEIDLKQLFNAIGNFFNGIGNSIINSIIKIRRRTIEFKWLFLVIVLLGLIVGIGFYFIVKPVYSSSMLLSSDYFNGRIVDNSIEKLNLLCEEEDRIGLARELGIEKTVAKNITGFEANPFISENDRVENEILKQKLSVLDLDESEIKRVLDRIEIENKNTFQIIINVNESDVIGGLQPAIVNYFKNNEYIKNRILSTELKLKGRLEKLEAENIKIDSLKRAMIKVFESISTKSRQGSDNLYIGEQYSADPMQVFTEDLRINNEMLVVKEKLYLNEDFEVVDGLTVFKEPVSAGLLKTLIYSVLISLGTAYFLIIIISINRYLIKIESERFA